MDKANEKHFGLRVDGDILAKFRYVCGFEGRSANAQIIQLMLYLRYPYSLNVLCFQPVLFHYLYPIVLYRL